MAPGRFLWNHRLTAEWELEQEDEGGTGKERQRLGGDKAGRPGAFFVVSIL